MNDVKEIIQELLFYNDELNFIENEYYLILADHHMIKKSRLLRLLYKLGVLQGIYDREQFLDDYITWFISRCDFIESVYTAN